LWLAVDFAAAACIRLDHPGVDGEAFTTDEPARTHPRAISTEGRPV
jgi:hypothetical protein